MVLSNPAIKTVLQRWYQGEVPCDQDCQILLTEALEAPGYARAFNLKSDTCFPKIEARAKRFMEVYPSVLALCQQLKLTSLDHNLMLLWNFWLPTAMQLVEAKVTKSRPLVQGILGEQGTGKTTLATILKCILAEFDYSTLTLSIDDLYKTYAERQALQQQDPRLIWRGPPGTHDVTLGIEVLDQICQSNGQKTIMVPRFDKSAHHGAGDRTESEAINSADIVLFEGWFLGVRPVSPHQFEAPPSPIDDEEDCQFAREMNEQLKAYLPLWERLDRLLVLYPVDYRLSKQWRREAEDKMKATGKPGMSDEEIERFVEYFWRSLHPELFITPLINNPALVDLVVEIDANHSLKQIYKPSA